MQENCLQITLSQKIHQILVPDMKLCKHLKVVVLYLGTLEDTRNASPQRAGFGRFMQEATGMMSRPTGKV